MDRTFSICFNVGTLDNFVSCILFVRRYFKSYSNVQRMDETEQEGEGVEGWKGSLLRLGPVGCH